MSTNSTISIKVSTDMIGKTISLNANLLHAPIKSADTDSEVEFSGAEPVTITNEFLTIYHHWDGYVLGGLGERLLKDYDTEEKVLNLMCLGDISSMANERNPCLMPYCVLGREDWEDLKPLQSDEMAHCQEYSYLFENGKWYVFKNGKNKTLLSKIVKAQNEKKYLDKVEKKQAATASAS